MIQEVGVDMTTKLVLWVKARTDYETLFSILDGMRQDAGRRFGIERLEASEDNCDIEEDLGQMSTGVKIAFPMSHNVLTIVEEYVQRLVWVIHDLELHLHAPNLATCLDGRSDDHAICLQRAPPQRARCHTLNDHQPFRGCLGC